MRPVLTVNLLKRRECPDEQCFTPEASAQIGVDSSVLPRLEELKLRAPMVRKQPAPFRLGVVVTGYNLSFEMDFCIYSRAEAARYFLETVQIAVENAPWRIT